MEHLGKNLHNDGTYNIIHCETCGFVHVYPFPEKQLIQSMYEKEYFQKLKSQDLEKTLSELEWLELQFERRLRLVNRHLIQDQKPKRVLDVGASGGFFLQYCLNNGWEIEGIEPSEKALKFAHEKFNLNLKNGFFSDFDDRHIGKFDLINMTFLLEHCQEAKQVIQQCSTMLNDNGLLLIEVPNDFNELQQLVVDRLELPKWWIVPTQHINYFTFDSLSKFLVKEGFTILESTTTWPMEFFLMMGHNYIDNPAIGPECHRWRKNFESNFASGNKLDVLECFYQQIAKINLGRTIIMIAQKTVN